MIEQLCQMLAFCASNVCSAVEASSQLGLKDGVFKIRSGIGSRSGKLDKEKEHGSERITCFPWRWNCGPRCYWTPSFDRTVGVSTVSMYSALRA